MFIPAEFCPHKDILPKDQETQLRDVHYAVKWRYEKTIFIDDCMSCLRDYTVVLLFFTSPKINWMLITEVIFQGHNSSNPFSAGAAPRTPLEDLTTLHRSPIRWGGDTPLHTPLQNVLPSFKDPKVKVSWINTGNSEMTTLIIKMIKM